MSQMGRPYDDMFHPTTAAFYNYPTVYESWFPTKFDYCLSRRGFTWAGWFRGVWYYHMQKGKYFVMDKNGCFYCMNCDRRFSEGDEEIYVPEEDM